MEGTTEAPMEGTTEDPMANETSGLEPNDDSTTDPFTTDPTLPENTTVDIVSIIRERDSLKQEVDSLRVAVIILGIISAIAVIAAIIVIVWVIMKRRRSGRMKSCLNFSRITGNKRKDATTTCTNRTNGSHNGTELEERSTITTTLENSSKTRPKETAAKKPNLLPISNSKETPKANTNEGFEVNEFVSDSLYQPADYIPQPEREDSSDDGNVYEISDNDDQELYEEVVRKKIASVALNESRNVPKSDGKKNQAGDTEPASKKVYANSVQVPEAGGNYSSLDPATQYTHFYH